MDIINTILGTPLGFVIYYAYQVLGSYGLAIIAFAIIVKIPLFPVMLIAHRNSIRLLQLQPDLYFIKQRYAGDKERINEAQYELFSKEKYSPVLGIVPLLVQLVLVMGILQVMYHPLQYILRLESEVIDSLVQAYNSIYGVGGGFAEQLLVLQAFQQTENLPIFQHVLAGFDDGGRIFQLIQGLDLHFLGLNLGTSPSLLNPSLELVVVLLSAISALSFCLVQNAISPGALSQGKRTNIGLTVFTVGLSLYFALALPVGVGLYWTVGNFAAIGVVLLLCQLYPPKKLATEALVHIKAKRRTSEQLREDKLVSKGLRKKESADFARFKATKKQIVFYAISSGQYKYYKNTIDYLLEHSNFAIHYLTNDPNDAIFQQNKERLIPYYVSQRKAITLMLRLDADIFISTVPDLQSFHMKRSIVRDDIEYIFIPHGLTSLHLAAREKAYDYFDTVFCVGPHHAAEMRRREELANLPKKQLLKAGYGLYDQLVESYAEISHITNEKPQILIAPSWQVDNILDICIDDMLVALLGRGYHIIVRPHPQYTRIFPERMEKLLEHYSQFVKDGELSFELDFSDSKSIYTSDLLITDWSAIAYEFSYCTLKPSIFINTPMKMLNPNYEQYGLEVLNLSLRDKLGISVDVENIHTLDKVTESLLNDKKAYVIQIQEIVNKYLYCPGRNGEACGKYVMKKLDN